jgi:hypothetical protein
MGGRIEEYLKERVSRSVQIKLTLTGWKLARSKRIQFQSPVNRITVNCARSGSFKQLLSPT